MISTVELQHPSMMENPRKIPLLVKMERMSTNAIMDNGTMIERQRIFIFA
jgi:hypothetical protein